METDGNVRNILETTVSYKARARLTPILTHVVTYELVTSGAEDDAMSERVGEREKKWELWVARLLLSYLQYCVFYTSLAGLCDHSTESSHCAAHALRSADPV